MNGELAQLFALATHATAALRRPSGAENTVMGTGHSTEQFVGSLTFDGVPGADAWVRCLADDRIDRVWLAAAVLAPHQDRGSLPAHHAAAFAGGLQAGLLTTGAHGTRLWQASWQVGDRNAADRRIWLVSYVSQPTNLRPQRLDLHEAATNLDQALLRAEEFSVRHDLQPWSAIFANARALWTDGGDQAAAYHRDLFPDGWDDADGSRLADMAQVGWVFGGMGSWNDLGFPDPTVQADYDQISEELFAAVMRAIVAAANTDPW